MKNLLFITSRNAYNTSGELRLIKNRANSLSDEFGVSTDVVNIKDRKVLSKPQENLNVRSYKLFAHRNYNTMSCEKMALEYIISLASKTTYDCVVISGVSLLHMITPLRKIMPNTRFVADLHGAFEELKEFKAKSFAKNIARTAFYLYAKHAEEKYLLQFDNYFAVSHALKRYMNKEYGLDESKFFIVPCAISTLAVDEVASKEYRKTYREKYQIDDDTILCIYSGGTSPWQCIEETVEMYKKMRETSGEKLKLLLLSGNLPYIKKFECEDIIADSYSGDEVRKVLCAGDYAFMLRGNYITNNVAYPNKFLEYVSAGLKVIATPYVYDVADQIKENNLGLIVDFNDNLPVVEKSVYLSDIQNRNNLLKATCFKTTLARFAKALEK